MRDGILLTAGLAAVYFVFLLLRLFRVKGRKRQAVVKPVEREPAIIERIPDPPVLAAMEPREVAGQSAPTQRFGDQLQRFGMESDFLRVQQDLAVLRSEVGVIREELERIKATRSVSPLYSEAMSMAERGHDAAGIAGRCGISIAEAELVAALAKNRGEFRDIEEVEDIYDRQGSAGERRQVA